MKLFGFLNKNKEKPIKEKKEKPKKEKKKGFFGKNTTEVETKSKGIVLQQDIVHTENIQIENTPIEVESIKIEKNPCVLKIEKLMRSFDEGSSRAKQLKEWDKCLSLLNQDDTIENKEINLQDVYWVFNNYLKKHREEFETEIDFLKELNFVYEKSKETDGYVYSEIHFMSKANEVLTFKYIDIVEGYYIYGETTSGVKMKIDAHNYRSMVVEYI